MSGPRPVLVFRVGVNLCALPLEVVHETLRPLALTPLAGAPPFVLGLSVIRGRPTPIVDLARLLFDRAHPSRRWLTVRVGPRDVALAVRDVVGVRDAGGLSLETTPALLGELGSETLGALGRLDEDLLLVLQAGLRLPESVWEAVERAGSNP